MAKKKTAKSKSARPAKKTAGKKRATAPAARKVPATPKSPAQKKQPAKVQPAEDKISLGRPKVTGEELLYMLFKDDYHARQIFEFLRVETVKELEQHSAREIIKRLSQPIEQTVDRIRRALAERNRCLAGDEQFAAEYKASLGGAER
jgi:hypothetical protein